MTKPRPDSIARDSVPSGTITAIRWAVPASAGAGPQWHGIPPANEWVEGTRIHDDPRDLCRRWIP